MIHQGLEYTLFVDIPTTKALGLKAALLLALLEKTEREQAKKGEFFQLTNDQIAMLLEIKATSIKNAIEALQREGYIKTEFRGNPPRRMFQILHYEK